MSIKQFIEKAIEGGYKPEVMNWDSPPIEHFYLKIIPFDPKAWQAVDRIEGWHDNGCIIHKGNWKTQMHALIDALAEGKDIETFLKTL